MKLSDFVFFQEDSSLFLPLKLGLKTHLFNMTCLSGPCQTLRNQPGWTYPNHAACLVPGLELMVYRIWIASWIERWLRCIPNTAGAHFSLALTSFYRLWNLHGLHVCKPKRKVAKKTKLSEHCILVISFQVSQPWKPLLFCSRCLVRSYQILLEFLLFALMLFIMMFDWKLPANNTRWTQFHIRINKELE